MLCELSLMNSCSSPSSLAALKCTDLDSTSPNSSPDSGFLYPDEATVLCASDSLLFFVTIENPEVMNEDYWRGLQIYRLSKHRDEWEWQRIAVSWFCIHVGTKTLCTVSVELLPWDESIRKRERNS